MADSIVPGYIEDTRTDPLYRDAMRAVLDTNRASIATVQRVLRIGYNRAARMIETMEAEGFVSPPGFQTGERKVLHALHVALDNVEAPDAWAERDWSNE